MRLRVLVVLAALLPAGCGAEDAALPVVEVVLGTGVQAVAISAEVAATPDQRSQGLMGRTALGPDEGMLFLFPEPVRVGFFMKNTLIPLDIAFIGRGTVLEVRSMVPCESDPCPVTYPSVAYEQALEVSAGTFERVGVEPGIPVEIRGDLPQAS